MSIDAPVTRRKLIAAELLDTLELTWEDDGVLTHDEDQMDIVLVAFAGIEAETVARTLDELERLWKAGDSNDEGENVGNTIAALRGKGAVARVEGEMEREFTGCIACGTLIPNSAYHLYEEWQHADCGGLVKRFKAERARKERDHG